jgi:transposase InsO family protein
MMAKVMGINTQSLRRWKKRSKKVAVAPIRRGRPEVIPPEARWKIRRCYQDHFGQWGPSVLRCWAIREGIGTWSVGTVAKVIADLASTPEVIPKPKKYEIASPMAMWSEDGTCFKERGRKKELLVLQDECSRYKINRRLASGPADATEVADYLKEAFDRHGAPLVLKHDGGSIFHDGKVKNLLDKHDVVELTSPPYYPPFNGKKERSMRDIKSYERALRKHGKGTSLLERIDITMHDLNDERPRPVLGGRTAIEVFEKDRSSLPNRKRFKMEVETRRVELEARAGSRKEIQAARRKAVIEVLMRYNLLNWRGDVSTNLQRQVWTN